MLHNRVSVLKKRMTLKIRKQHTLFNGSDLNGHIGKDADDYGAVVWVLYKQG